GPRNPDFRNHKLPDKSALRGADRDAGTSAALVRKTLAPKYTGQIRLCGGTDRRKRTDSFCTFHSDVAGLQSHPERQRDKERNKESGECGYLNLEPKYTKEEVLLTSSTSWKLQALTGSTVHSNQSLTSVSWTSSIFQSWLKIEPLGGLPWLPFMFK
ncbi:hypothetical protein MJG53_002856, partial [Ovis ammon polii x Ovis aries]